MLKPHPSPLQCQCHHPLNLLRVPCDGKGGNYTSIPWEHDLHNICPHSSKLPCWQLCGQSLSKNLPLQAHHTSTSVITWCFNAQNKRSGWKWESGRSWKKFLTATLCTAGHRAERSFMGALCCNKRKWRKSGAAQKSSARHSQCNWCHLLRVL